MVGVFMNKLLVCALLISGVAYGAKGRPDEDRDCAPEPITLVHEIDEDTLPPYEREELKKIMKEMEEFQAFIRKHVNLEQD